jgi:hypothetical protein
MRCDGQQLSASAPRAPEGTLREWTLSNAYAASPSDALSTSGDLKSRNMC